MAPTSKLRFIGEVRRDDDYVWSARDRELGSTGRRMGDPEYEGFVFMRGVLHPRSLADDGARLLNKKERAAFDYTLACAHRDPRGWAISLEHHLPDDVRRLPGPTPVQVGINIGIDGVVYEPRWTLRHANGELLGGRLYPEQCRTAPPPQPVQVPQTVHVVPVPNFVYHPAPEIVVQNGRAYAVKDGAAPPGYSPPRVALPRNGRAPGVPHIAVEQRPDGQEVRRVAYSQNPAALPSPHQGNPQIPYHPQPSPQIPQPRGLSRLWRRS
jgi:hypothetical protein